MTALDFCDCIQSTNIARASARIAFCGSLPHFSAEPLDEPALEASSATCGSPIRTDPQRQKIQGNRSKSGDKKAETLGDKITLY